jgi:hypothetical protein
LNKLYRFKCITLFEDYVIYDSCVALQQAVDFQPCKCHFSSKQPHDFIEVPVGLSGVCTAPFFSESAQDSASESPCPSAVR